MVGVLVGWLAVATVAGVVLGRAIRLADQRSPHVFRDLVPDSLASVAAASLPVARQSRRRVVPLPPVGIALAALAVALETAGFLSRLIRATGPAARTLSMDAPFSLPRLYVAALFAAAALAAVAGAAGMPGRRTWWMAVGAVSAGIAAAKAGSTVHAQAMRALDHALGATGATLVSAAAAAVVVGALWFLSRTERRDRRRVLGVLASYAVASVGLSAVSTLTARVYGGASSWASAATFLEESGEALAGVAFLVAVLVGVAPRLVLPPEWVLRRQADAHTVDLPELLRVRADGTTARP